MNWHFEHRKHQAFHSQFHRSYLTYVGSAAETRERGIQFRFSSTHAVWLSLVQMDERTERKLMELVIRLNYSSHKTMSERDELDHWEILLYSSTQGQVWRVSAKWADTWTLCESVRVEICPLITQKKRHDDIDRFLKVKINENFGLPSITWLTFFMWRRTFRTNSACVER